LDVTGTEGIEEVMAGEPFVRVLGMFALGG
jgi:hypothetical protein